MVEMVGTVLQTAVEKLKLSSESAKLDAELLLSEVLACTRSQLYAYPERLLTQQEQKRFNELLMRRQTGEPIAYLLGYKEFWSLRLQVNPSVLIPRPETELLVQLALDHLPINEPLAIADLGTGSGAIALALAHERPQWQIWATDQSEAALTVASHNALLLKLENIHFHQGSWCQALPDKQFAAIVSNPPYLADNDPHLAQDGLPYEPQGALASGIDGLTALQEIISTAHLYLQTGGWLMLEHGYNQAKATAQLFHSAGFNHITLHTDLAGLPRVTMGELY